MRFPRKTAVTAVVLLAVAGALFWFYENVHSRIIFGIREDFSRAIPYDKPVPGIPGIRAEQCGACHQAIYEEWKTSYHAQAYVDPFFQAYWKKDEHIWICLNCHTPMEPQQPWIIKGLKDGKVHKPIKVDNPNYDPEYQKEGISCATCHVRDGVIEGPYEDSIAPHPTRFHPRFRTTDICFTCHQVPSGPFQFYEGGPCSTFPEFEGGPYFKQGMICQDCHMPAVERPIAEGGPVRHGRRHLWQGGHFPEMVQRAIRVEIHSDPSVFEPGKETRIVLTLTNSGAGHKIPTGDPDRFFTVEFELKDAQGKVLKQQSHTMSRWIIWKPFIVEVYENRLVPLASRDYSFRFRVPRQPEGLTLTTRIRYHILTDKQYEKLKTKYGLAGEVPYRFTVFERAFPLSGPVTVQLDSNELQRLNDHGLRCQAG